MATKWFNVNWSYRNKFTIKNAGAALNNFPVTINILASSGDYIRWDLMNDGGTDIRFCDGDGNTELNFEIERCNKYDKILAAHVKLPTMSGSVAAQPIYMYYGNSNASAKDASWAQGVWDENYVVVHHFGQTTGNYEDSTSKNLDSVAISGLTTVASRSANMVGLCPNNTTAATIDLGRPSDLNDITTVTLEVYARADSASNDLPIADKKVWYFWSDSYYLVYWRDFDGASDGKWTCDTKSFPANGSKRHVAVTYDCTSIDNNPTFYENGNTLSATRNTQGAGSAKSDANYHLRLMDTLASTAWWAGLFDEFRVSNIQRSSTWIAATAKSLIGQMVSKAGPLEYCPSSGVIEDWWDDDWVYRKKISSNALMCSPYTSGSHFLQITTDLNALVSSNKVNAGYDDVRIVCQTPLKNEEVARYIASGITPAKIYFPCNFNLPSGIDVGEESRVHYYMYYGNNTPGSEKTWINYNFPQAPYSVRTEENKSVSGCYDKFFLRMNEASDATTIKDYTNHFTGNFTPKVSGSVEPGHPGILDRAVYFDGNATDSIVIPGRHYCNGSGLYTLDMWVRPTNYNAKGTAAYRPITPAGSLNLKSTTSTKGSTQTRWNHTDGPQTITSPTLTGTPVPTSGWWYFVRVIAANNSPDWFGIWVGTSGLPLVKQRGSSLTPSASNNTAPFILGNALNTNLTPVASDAKPFQGWIEQVRFSTAYLDLAVSGIKSTKWFASPDWIPHPYILTMNVEESSESGIYYSSVPPARFGGYYNCVGHPTRPDKQIIGGYFFSKTVYGNHNYALIGGLFRAIDLTCPTAIIGGYISSVVVTDNPACYIGAYQEGRNIPAASFGGFTYGQPSNVEYVETHARTLVKANSRITIGQEINIDGQVTFKGLGSKDFNALFTMMNTDASDFNAKINIQKYRKAPTVTITSVSPSVGTLTDGACQVTVSATGSFGDGTEWKHAYIDFGEPYGNDTSIKFNDNASISGFDTNPVWTTSHDYHASGVYNIVVRAIDENGCIGSDVAILNLASGLVAGVDYPKLDIGATPRSGYVPDPLLVDFHVHCSGASLGAPADSRILWNFGNLETSQLQSPSTYYSSPGMYAPTIRLRYRNNQGDIIWVADSLLLGFNN